MKFYPILLAAALLSACSLKSDDSASGGDGGGSAPTSLAPGHAITSAAKAKVGMTIKGEIKEGGESDFYFFDNPGKLRDIAVVRLENMSTTLRPNIKIYNSERSQLFNVYDYTNGANVEQALSIEPGKGIYVEVLPFNTAGEYQLSVKAQKAYDANEANDDQFTATTLKFGDAIEGSILDGNDSDWFHVTPATSGKVTIAFENLSSSLRPNVAVYSAMKSQVANQYDYTNGAGLDFTVDLQPGQDFYVEVRPFNTNGKYRLATRPAVLAGDMASALQDKGSIALYGVYFDVDKVFIKPESANTLSEVANLLKADRSLRLEVAGHTDNTGTKAHNMELSKGRAEAVVTALTAQYGIDAGRLVAKGYGDTKPVADNETPANKAKNRRVELKKL